MGSATSSRGTSRFNTVYIIRVGRQRTFSRAPVLLTSCACTDLRSAQLTSLLSATPLSPRAPGHRHARVHRAPDPMYSAGHILSARSFLATLFPGLLIRRALPLSASSGAFSFILSILW